MWRARRSPADVLNRYWNSRGTAELAARPPTSQLDPTLVEALERLYARDDAQMPDPRYLDRLERILMDTLSLHPGMAPLKPAPAMNPNGRAAPSRSQGPQALRPIALPRTRGWVVAQLATAALVLLTLLGSFVAFHGLPRPAEQNEPPVIIPAVDATPEPTLPAGVTADVTFLKSRIDEMPAYSGVFVGIQRITLDPGAVETAGASDDTGVGPDLFTVESGRVTVAADAAVEFTRGVARSGSRPSAVPAGTPVTLDVGDQLYAPNAVTLRRSNPGSTPATILDFQIANMGELTGPAGVTYDGTFPYTTLGTAPPPPVVATVHRLTLAAGTELPGSAIPGLSLAYVEAGTLTVSHPTSGNAATPAQVRSARAGSGVTSFGRNPDKAILANYGSEPTVFLVASVVPLAEPSPATPTAQAPGTPAGVSEDTVLFHQLLDEIPADASWAGVERDPLAPGVTWRQGTADTNGVGPMLYKVESGTVTLRADGPVALTRAGAQSPTEMSPATDVVLKPGDIAYLRSGVASEWRNDGPAEAILLDTGISTAGPVPTIPQTAPIDGWPLTPPPAPAELTVHRLTLEPGASLPNGPEPGLKLVGVESETLTVSWAKRADPATQTGTHAFPAGSYYDINGKDVIANELRNDGTEPLVMLVMTVVPVAEGAATPTADGSSSPAPLLNEAPSAAPRNERTDGVAGVTLLQQTFNEISEQAASVGTGRAVLEPGAEWTLGKNVHGSDGPRAYVVETGALTVQADGPIPVTRAGTERAVEVPAGTDVVLTAGDRAFMPYGVTAHWRNDGTNRTSVLDAWITELGVAELPQGVTYAPLIDLWPVATPKTPVTLTVNRTTLAARHRLAASRIPGLAGFYVEGGTLNVVDTKGTGEQATTFGVPAGNGRVFGGSGYKSVPATWTLEDAGSDPVTFLLMTISNANPLEVTPMG